MMVDSQDYSNVILASSGLDAALEDFARERAHHELLGMEYLFQTQSHLLTLTSGRAVTVSRCSISEYTESYVDRIVANMNEVLSDYDYRAEVVASGGEYLIRIFSLNHSENKGVVRDDEQ